MESFKEHALPDIIEGSLHLFLKRLKKLDLPGMIEGTAALSWSTTTTVQS